MDTLSHSDYESLAEIRYRIRCFLHFSEEAARKAGLETRQHQLLLAIRGLPKNSRPLIGTLAERLQIRHHSAVELVDRLSRGGYIRRQRNSEDRREVLLCLTAKGEKVLHKLSVDHRAELQNAGPALMTALDRLLRGPKRTTERDRRAGKTSSHSRPAMRRND